ncbi:MAG TPA: right-handed parallel beta-helix repeat-containing protein [Bryobacteraceae bacterium]|nr:right-handed parallel beta-helix repeat-containing protein [Bryobacteraceae bacterium]
MELTDDRHSDADGDTAASSPNSFAQNYRSGVPLALGPKARFFFLALAVSSSALAAAPSINLSHDLVSLGIAKRNLTPNDASLDARPLFQAALAYAAKNETALITADAGAYYFLTPQLPDRYLQIDAYNNLTIDLAGSDLYLAQPEIVGFALIDCANVTLANFTIDSLQLPFTQVQLTGVSAQKALQYQAIPGWPSPTTFNTVRDPSGTPESLTALVFRNGQLIAGTSVLPIQRPLTEGTLRIVTSDSPWTQPQVLATYQPGDTIVIMAKGGEAPILVEGGTGTLVTGVTVYSSGAIAVHLDNAANSIVDHVQVIPRPETDRLISSNADGIHLSYALANNTVRHSSVNRTGDDGIAINSPFLAFVTSQPGANKIVAARNYSSIFPNGLLVSFVDPSTGLIVGSAHIAAQSPAYSDPLNNTGPVTLTFGQNLPALANGFGMIFGDLENRGNGSVIENNTVRNVLTARGIYLGGVAGVTVDQNLIDQTDCGAIVVHQDLSAYPVGPAMNIRITNNTIRNAIGPEAVATGAIAAIASIFTLSTDQNFNFITGAPNSNITISGNSIVNSGRGAIWVGNVNGGLVENNSALLYNQHPELAYWGVSTSVVKQLKQDSTQPVVVRSSSSGVTVLANRASAGASK